MCSVLCTLCALCDVLCVLCALFDVLCVLCVCVMCYVCVLISLFKIRDIKICSHNRVNVTEIIRGGSVLCPSIKHKVRGKSIKCWSIKKDVFIHYLYNTLDYRVRRVHSIEFYLQWLE